MSKEVFVSKYEVERDPTIMVPVTSQNRAGSFHTSLPTALENPEDEFRDWYYKLCSIDNEAMLRQGSQSILMYRGGMTMS